MSTPDPLQVLAGLRHCVQAGDYASAALKVSQPAVLEAIAGLAMYAQQQRAEADAAYREAAAVRLAEAERARVQAEIGPLLEELIGVLAGAMGVNLGPLCIRCRRALRRCRSCPYCGMQDARSAA